MDIVAGSKNDEFYTPRYAVKPILKYINPKSTIWCPFDTSESEYIKQLSNAGHKVYNTHISNGAGEDFFKISPIECDYIISNPPYSKKTEVLERLFEYGIPFAMLVGVVGLFESKKRFNMFRNNNFEILYLDKRVSYFSDNDKSIRFNPPFQSVYICHKMLPKKIMFEEIDKKDI